MPKGLKQTSSQLVVSFGLTESGPNSITDERIDLQLNALDNEVFVVTGVKLDLEAPSCLVGATPARYKNQVALTKQNPNQVLMDLSQSTCFATSSIQIFTIADANTGVSFISTVMENDTDAPTNVEYLDIIATPDFYVQIQGTGQTDEMSVSGKLYGYRAKADASTYAGLVQSELLSA